MSIPTIRKLLLANPDGMTSQELAVAVYRNSKRQAAVNKSLDAMHEAYVDRYVQTTGHGRSEYAAVWCVVEVPEDCPHPKETA